MVFSMTHPVLTTERWQLLNLSEHIAYAYGLTVSSAHVRSHPHPARIEREHPLIQEISQIQDLVDGPHLM